MTNTRLRQRCSGLGAVHHQTVGKIGESGGPPNALHFCCGGAPRPRGRASDPRPSAGRPRQQQMRVRRSPGRGRPEPPRAAYPWMPGSGGPAIAQEPRLLDLILPPSRHPGKEGRAGPPELRERRAVVGMPAGRPVVARQPPRASFPKAKMGWPRRPRTVVMPATRSSAPPSRHRGPPAGTRIPGPMPTARHDAWARGCSTTKLLRGSVKAGGPPHAPVSSKRGLG
jgi:hypothetical protein